MSESTGLQDVNDLPFLPRTLQCVLRKYSHVRVTLKFQEIMPFCFSITIHDSEEKTNGRQSLEPLEYSKSLMCMKEYYDSPFHRDERGGCIGCTTFEDGEEYQRRNGSRGLLVPHSAPRIESNGNGTYREEMIALKADDDSGGNEKIELAANKNKGESK